MARVVNTGGDERLRRMFANIRAKLPETLQSVGAVIAAEASARAPSPQEEYETMMVGSGNPEGITGVAPMPLSLSDSDPDSKRLRFYKPEAMYLQNAIIDNYAIDGLVVGVGNVAMLDAASHYEWRNVTGDIYECSFPFWRAWEGGIDGSFFISPKHFTGKHTPTLKPGSGPDNQRYFMYKSIDAHHMYGGINIDRYIERILIPAVREIARSS